MPVALGRRRKAKKQVQQERKEIMNPDFWERHRLTRDGSYEIPPGNLKSATRERARMLQETRANWDDEALEEPEGSFSDYD